MPMSGRSVGQLSDLYPKILRFGLNVTEFEPRTRILPASIELSGDYSRHAHNTLEQFLKCTIVLSTCVPFGSAKIGQTAICRSGPALSRLCRPRATFVPYLLRSLLPLWPTPYHGFFLPDDRSFSAPPATSNQPTSCQLLSPPPSRPYYLDDHSWTAKRPWCFPIFVLGRLGKIFSMSLCATLSTFLCACRARMPDCPLCGEGGHLTLSACPRAGM